MPAIHVFQAGSSDTVAYTFDQDGSNLPRGVVRGEWERVGEAEVASQQSPLAGTDAALVLAAIERDGFYIAVDLATTRPRQAAA